MYVARRVFEYFAIFFISLVLGFSFVFGRRGGRGQMGLDLCIGACFGFKVCVANGESFGRSFFLYCRGMKIVCP